MFYRRLETLQVSYGCGEIIDAILEITKPDVALHTQQSTYFICYVAMIDATSITKLGTTNGAFILLAQQHGI
jgi:hypothetical protein